MKLEVVTPEESMGDVIGDLNKRRGQVEGMESSRTGARIVKAKVPLSEQPQCLTSGTLRETLESYALLAELNYHRLKSTLHLSLKK